MSIPLPTIDSSEIETANPPEEGLEMNLPSNLIFEEKIDSIDGKNDDHKCSHSSELSDTRKSVQSDFTRIQYRVKSIIKVICLVLLVLCTLISLVVSVFKGSMGAEDMRQQTVNTIKVLTQLASIQSQPQ